MARNENPGPGYGQPKQFTFNMAEMSILFDLLDHAWKADPERYAKLQWLRNDLYRHLD